MCTVLLLCCCRLQQLPAASAAALLKTDKLLSLRARTKREKKDLFQKHYGGGLLKMLVGLMAYFLCGRTDGRTDGQKEVVFGVCLPQEKEKKKLKNIFLNEDPHSLVETSSTVWE